MIISCPECGSKFELPDNALGEKGRKVKCSSCTHIWRALPQTDSESNPPKTIEIANPIIETSLENPSPSSPESGPLPAPLDDAKSSGKDLRAHARNKGKHINKDNSRNKKRAKGALVAIILGALTFTLIIAKDKIISFVPESSLAYEALGLIERPLEERIQITLPSSGINWQEGSDNILIIEGEIKNLTNKAIILPSLIAQLTLDNTIIEAWRFTLDDPLLPANGTLTYHHSLPNITTADGQIEIRLDETQNIMDAPNIMDTPNPHTTPESHTTPDPPEETTH